MSKDSIRLHPEHGLNPALEICPFCGKERGVALLGYNKGKKAPRHVVTSMEPCPECQAHMDKGITIIEATEVKGEPRMTGRWLVTTEEAISRMLKNPEPVLKARKAFMDRDIYQKILDSTVSHEQGQA